MVLIKLNFNAQTNKDTKLGNISDIASGGEFSRTFAGNESNH